MYWRQLRSLRTSAKPSVLSSTCFPCVSTATYLACAKVAKAHHRRNLVGIELFGSCVGVGPFGRFLLALRAGLRDRVTAVVTPVPARACFTGIIAIVRPTVAAVVLMVSVSAGAALAPVAATAVVPVASAAVVPIASAAVITITAAAVVPVTVAAAVIAPSPAAAVAIVALTRRFVMAAVPRRARRHAVVAWTPPTVVVVRRWPRRVVTALFVDVVVAHRRSPLAHRRTDLLWWWRINSPTHIPNC